MPIISYISTYSLLVGHTYIVVHCKRQKLSERKVSQFTGIHPNVGKTFVVFALSAWKVLKKAIAKLNICWESSCD